MRKAIARKSPQPSPTPRESRAHQTGSEDPAIDAGIGMNALPQIPADMRTTIEAAIRSGQWMIAVFRIEDGKLFLNRTALDFPKVDLDAATRLVVESLNELKTSR